MGLSIDILHPLGGKNKKGYMRVIIKQIDEMDCYSMVTPENYNEVNHRLNDDIEKGVDGILYRYGKKVYLIVLVP